jgi:hypothetical protein
MLIVEFYLETVSPARFVTSSSNMEVVPRGLIVIGDKTYRTVGDPCFIMDARNNANMNSYFRKVAVIVEEVNQR